MEGLQIAGQNIPAKEVGGDFFDYLQCEDKVLVAVGDVSGKCLIAEYPVVIEIERLTRNLTDTIH